MLAGEAQTKSVMVAIADALPLYHTMSALVAQRLPLGPVADQAPAPGALAADSPAPHGLEQGQMAFARLTEAILAAAENVRSSAEKLPVSHRLPVSRSIFDSDEGDCLLPPSP